jgi:hypothetical protein
VRETQLVVSGWFVITAVAGTPQVYEIAQKGAEGELQQILRLPGGRDGIR